MGGAAQPVPDGGTEPFVGGQRHDEDVQGLGIRLLETAVEGAGETAMSPPASQAAAAPGASVLSKDSTPTRLPSEASAAARGATSLPEHSSSAVAGA